MYSDVIVTAMYSFEFRPWNVILIDFFGAEVAAQLTKFKNLTTLISMDVYRGRSVSEKGLVIIIILLFNHHYYITI